MKKLLLPGRHNVGEFAAALLQLEREHFASVLVLAAEGTVFTKAEYDPVLQNTNLKVTGGLFPEILFEGERYTDATVIVAFKETMHTADFLDFTPDKIKERIDCVFANVDPVDKTIFIFIDAFALNKTNLTDALYNSFGTLPRYVGGGTGSLKFEGIPCVFSNTGLIQGGAVVSIIDLQTSLGVSHGWEVISEPLKVTEAEHNKIKSLEWRPAMDIYREVIQRHSNQIFKLETFFEATQSYAFGIAKLGGEMVVRDPFKQEDGSIFTLDNIEQGSHVHVLFGEQNQLLEGAKRARDLAVQSSTGIEKSECFIIDCISRLLFMNQDFNQEIYNLDPHRLGFGAFTLGEIANSGECYLEIFNKTAVVCKLDEPE
ncbi:MAG: FIST C-terminal domain-containing protein [Saprospiraceae bacterium]|nr:FIST C-terminal domain-containing protein [Saprospiraceae bacterium]